MDKPRIYTYTFDRIYQLYIAKAERKGRTQDEVEQITLWFTGYTKKQLEAQIKKQVDLETFYKEAKLNPLRTQIKGVVCGVRVEEIKDPTMQAIRYMDKLIDELAKGKTMDYILRK